MAKLVEHPGRRRTGQELHSYLRILWKVHQCCLRSIDASCFVCLPGFYSSTDHSATDEESAAVITRALELGIRLLDTSDLYGPHTNEELIGAVLLCLQPWTLPMQSVAPRSITKNNRAQFVLFGMQSRTLGPFLATMHSIRTLPYYPVSAPRKGRCPCGTHIFFVLWMRPPL
jgi:Aldo/keto reductase family